MNYGFEFYDDDGKISLSSDTLYFQLVDSFVVEQSNGNGSKDYPLLSNNIKASVINFNQSTSDFCISSVVGNTVNWAWEKFYGSTTTNKAIIYVYAN